MAVTTSYKIDRGAVDKLLVAPSSPVAKYLRTLGEKVVRAARAQAPRGQTGRLQSDIRQELVGSGRSYVIRIGHTATVPQGAYQSLGTPRQNPGAFIFPKRAKFLVFKIEDQTIFARKVRGVKPNPYLRDALTKVIASA